MQIDQEAIQAAVIDRVSEEILSDWDFKSESRELIGKKINEAFLANVNVAIAETVKTAVDEGFDREYFRTDSFGKRVGGATSIRAELASLISTYWSTPVDRNGKPSASSYDTKHTRAEWHMIQVCGEGFQKDLKQEVVNITAGFKDGLRAQLRGSMDKMLNDLFKVKSTQDATEKLY